MARVSKITLGKIPLLRGTHWFPSFFVSFAQPASVYSSECVCVYTHTHILKNTEMYVNLTACRLYMNYRCYQVTLQGNVFAHIWSVAKC